MKRILCQQLPYKSIPRWVRRDLCSKLCIRSKSNCDGPTREVSLNRWNPSNTTKAILGSPMQPLQCRPRPVLANGWNLQSFDLFTLDTDRPFAVRTKPQHIVIYHAGTGKIAFIGMMRLTTILIFVVSCTVVAPAFYVADFPWYIAPGSEISTSRNS
jgi:hypothetical protein